MKLTIDPADFSDAVTWAIQNYDVKDSQSYVALTVERKTGKASLTHVNQTSHMKASLTVTDLEFGESETEESYSVPLDGQYLKNLASVVKRTGATELVASKNLGKKNDPLKIKGDKQSFTVPVLTIQTKSDPELNVLAEANDSEFFSALQRLAKLCTVVTADTGAATGAVAVKLSEDKLVLMATDSYSFGELILGYEPHRKAVAKFIEEATNGDTVLIPKNAALTVKPSKVATDTVEFVYDSSSQKFGYRFDDGRIALFSLDQSTPTAYEMFKNSFIESSTESVDMKLADLASAIDSVAALNPEEQDITMKIKGGKKAKVTISDSKGSNSISVDVEDFNFDGSVEFVFFREVIRKALSPLYSGSLRFFFAPEDTKVAILRPIDDSQEIDENVFALAIMSI